MIITLKIIVNYDILDLKENYQGICFMHAFSKASQYVITNEVFCKGLRYVSIKTTKGDL